MAVNGFSAFLMIIGSVCMKTMTKKYKVWACALACLAVADALAGQTTIENAGEMRPEGPYTTRMLGTFTNNRDMKIFSLDTYVDGWSGAHSQVLQHCRLGPYELKINRTDAYGSMYVGRADGGTIPKDTALELDCLYTWYNARPIGKKSTVKYYISSNGGDPYGRWYGGGTVTQNGRSCEMKGEEGCSILMAQESAPWRATISYSDAITMGKNENEKTLLRVECESGTCNTMAYVAECTGALCKYVTTSEGPIDGIARPIESGTSVELKKTMDVPVGTHHGNITLKITMV